MGINRLKIINQIDKDGNETEFHCALVCFDIYTQKLQNNNYQL